MVDELEISSSIVQICSIKLKYLAYNIQMISNSKLYITVKTLLKIIFYKKLILVLFI